MKKVGRLTCYFPEVGRARIQVGHFVRPARQFLIKIAGDDGGQTNRIGIIEQIPIEPSLQHPSKKKFVPLQCVEAGPSCGSHPRAMDVRARYRSNWCIRRTQNKYWAFMMPIQFEIVLDLMSVPGISRNKDSGIRIEISVHSIFGQENRRMFFVVRRRTPLSVSSQGSRFDRCLTRVGAFRSALKYPTRFVLEIQPRV